MAQAWACAHCTLVNAGPPECACTACGLPGPAGSDMGRSLYEPAEVSKPVCAFDQHCRRRQSAHFQQTRHLSPWNCPACTCFNQPSTVMCIACGGWRAPALTTSPSSSASPSSAAAANRSSAAADSAVLSYDNAFEEAETGEEEGFRTCPVQTCRVSVTVDEFAEHIQIHLIAGDDVDGDKNGDKELARLRKRYGLDPDPDNASYVQQYEKRLSALVSRGKLTAVEREAKLEAMRNSLEVGEGCSTAGIIPHIATALSFLHRSGRQTAAPEQLPRGQQTLSFSLASTSGGTINTSTHINTSRTSSNSTSTASSGGAVLGEQHYGRGTTWVLMGSAGIHAGGDFGDSGWGCGYRNIQMMCGYLLTCPASAQYKNAMFDGQGTVPTVPKLQEWLDRAWRSGFDREGAAQLEHVLSNTKKLIGATECATLLRSFGVRAYVVDFISPRLPAAEYERSKQQAAMDAARDNARHPGKKKKQARYVSPYAPCTAVIDFAWRYFAARQSHDSRAPEKFCPGLYLQHEGHSRTIVGVEEHAQTGEMTLLLFDPSQPGASIFGDVKNKRRLQRLRRGPHTLTHGKYQCVWVAPGIADEAERELLKTIAASPPEDAWNVEADTSVASNRLAATFESL